MEPFVPTIIFLAFLLFLSAFFSGSETALFSLSNIQLDRLARENTKYAKRIITLLEKPRKLIVTLLMGNELVNITISSFSAAIFAVLLPDNRWAPILILTSTILFFGEISPKSLAITRPMLFSRIISLPLAMISWIITPLRLVVENIVNLLLLRNPDTIQDAPVINEAEFRQLAMVGLAEGQLEEEEADMIQRVFNLGDLTVDKVMTPRTEIFAFEDDDTLEHAMEQLRPPRFSRIPIYNDSIDNIVGILHINDLLQYRLQEQNPKLESICRSPLFVPAYMKVDDLLRHFRINRIHMAVVLDEYGGTAGLVTLDDAMGELFGELPAERADDDFEYHRCENNDLIVAGGMDLDDFGELVQKVFENEPVETVAGLVFTRFGHLPSQGDKITIDSLRFTVLSVKENRIWRLRVSVGGAS